MNNCKTNPLRISAFHTLENRLDNVKSNVNSLSEYLQEATNNKHK